MTAVASFQIEYTQCLDPQGVATPELPPWARDPDALIPWYRAMVHTRLFDNKAIAYTYVPTTMRQYIKQQIRWNKSFYREMLWTIRYISEHHSYMLYDLAMQFQHFGEREEAHQASR